MWAFWFVLAGAVVMTPAAIVTSLRQRTALALMSDLEETMDRLGISPDDRTGWVPVLVTRNVPWESVDEIVAVARRDDGAVELRQGLGDRQQQYRLPDDGWLRSFTTPKAMTMWYRRPRTTSGAEGPAILALSARPEHADVFPDTPGRRFGRPFRREQAPS